MILLFPLLIYFRKLAGSSLCRDLKVSRILCVCFLGMNTHVRTPYRHTPPTRPYYTTYTHKHTHYTYHAINIHIHTTPYIYLCTIASNPLTCQHALISSLPPFLLWSFLSISCTCLSSVQGLGIPAPQTHIPPDVLS